MVPFKVGDVLTYTSAPDKYTGEVQSFLVRVESIAEGVMRPYRCRSLASNAPIEATYFDLKPSDGPTQQECRDKFESISGSLFGKRPGETYVCACCGLYRNPDDTGKPCTTKGCGSGVIECIPAGQPVRERRFNMPGTATRDLANELTKREMSKLRSDFFDDEEPTKDDITIRRPYGMKVALTRCERCSQMIRHGMVGIDDHLEGCAMRSVVFCKPSEMMTMGVHAMLRHAWGVPRTPHEARPQVDEDAFQEASTMLLREDACHSLLRTIVSSDDLDKETPRRMAKALGELTDGYGADFAAILKTFPRGDADTGVVIVRDIPFASVCEHHVLPFTGTATVAYLPGDRIVGLSKIPRLVRAVTRRLQVQERIGAMIADALMKHVGARGAFVVLKSKHTCMTLRGVECPGEMVTSTIRGVFESEHDARAEVLSLITK